MALEVEDGTAKTNSESYASTATVDTYVADYLGGDTTWDAASTTEKEVALREGTQYIEHTFGRIFVGLRYSEDQALSWPRLDVRDPDGGYVSATAIPVEVVRACAEAAVRAAAGTLEPDETDIGISAERVKVGTIEKETRYHGSKSTRTGYPKIARMLSRWTHEHGLVDRA